MNFITRIEGTVFNFLEHAPRCLEEHLLRVEAGLGGGLHESQLIRISELLRVDLGNLSPTNHSATGDNAWLS